MGDVNKKARKSCAPRPTPNPNPQVIRSLYAREQERAAAVVVVLRRRRRRQKQLACRGGERCMHVAVPRAPQDRGDPTVSGPAAPGSVVDWSAVTVSGGDTSGSSESRSRNRKAALARRVGFPIARGPRSCGFLGASRGVRGCRPAPPPSILARRPPATPARPYAKCFSCLAGHRVRECLGLGSARLGSAVFSFKNFFCKTFYIFYHIESCVICIKY